MKKLVTIVVILALIASLCGCRDEAVEMPTEAEALTGDEKVINIQMREADTIDPILTERQSVRDALMIVYEPLFDIDETFTIVPVLAQSYAFNENATVMTLKIKEGVLWHNGQLLNSEDVIYTIERIKANPTSSYYLNLASVERVEKLNDYEIVFYLTEPDAFLVYSLYFPIMRANADPLALTGTGAFMLKEMDGKTISLVKNSAWHKGEAMCDGVRIFSMRTSEMAQESFSAGKIHAVTRDMLDTENFAIKESNTKHIYPDGTFEFMGFNSSEGIFSDALLRIAATNAVDRMTLSRIYGDAVPSGFPVMPGSSAFSPSYEHSEYNLDYAKEVIFSAGWMDLDGNGKSEKIIDGNWTAMGFNLLVAKGDKMRSLAAEEVKKNLEAAGFTVHIELTDIDTYNEKIKEGDYDAFLGAVFCADPYDVSELLSSEGKVNFEGYSSPEMDFAVAEVMSATSVDKASVAFTRLQSLYVAYQPVAGLVFRTNYVVTSPYVEGEVKPYPYSPYANIALWQLAGVED